MDRVHNQSYQNLMQRLSTPEARLAYLLDMIEKSAGRADLGMPAVLLALRYVKESELTEAQRRVVNSGVDVLAVG